jgi:HPt (histidine-containing phosphotransfer) domain-containing protein
VNEGFFGGVWLCEGAKVVPLEEAATMGRAWSQVVVLSLVIASPGLLQAQKPTEKSKRGVPTQVLSGLGIARTQEQAEAMVAEGAGEPSTALQAVVQFLQLRPDQVAKLQQLLKARQETVQPLLQGIAELEKRLGELLESGSAPPEVGQVVIEIHNLQKQIGQIQQEFLANWENLLDPEQRQRLEGVHLAASLQPIVPAFQRLQLL